MRKRRVRIRLIDIAGIALGAALGWLFWRTIGCPTGVCPITSSPLFDTSYGALLGLLFVGLIPGNKKE